MKSNYWKTLSYITIAFAVMFAVAGMNGKVARADHGSDYDCYLWHDYEKCCGSNTGQNYLNGTTHVFKLQTPDELKDYPVTWTVSGTDIQSKAVQVEFLEKSNTSATVKFTGAHESPFSLGVDINAEINIPEGQGSAFADYWFDVYDEFYYSPTPTYVPLAVGSSQKLTCEVLKFDTTHPKGVTTTLTENLTWENAFPALDTGITVSADGTIKPSSGGMYMVLATLKDASPYVSKQFNVMAPASTLVSGQKVLVPSSYRGIVYAVKATVSDKYQLQYSQNTSGIDVYDAAGKCLNESDSQTTDGIQTISYFLTAGNTYYVNVIHSGTEPVSLTLIAPKGAAASNSQAKTYTVIFNKNGGTKLSNSNKSVTVNKVYGALPTVGRKGYAFKGWYTAKSGGVRITASTKVNINRNQTLYAQWTKISKPSKANILKIKNIKGKKLSIKLKKISNANGYQIIYATSSKMKGSKKTATTSVDKTIKKLQKGKTYYVKVRAYKLDSLKNKIYGSYSSIKKVKIKK